MPISHIGTDEMQAKALAERTVDTRGMGLNTTLWTPDPRKWTDCVPMSSLLTAASSSTPRSRAIRTAATSSTMRPAARQA